MIFVQFCLRHKTVSLKTKTKQTEKIFGINVRKTTYAFQQRVSFTRQKRRQLYLLLYYLLLHFFSVSTNERGLQNIAKESAYTDKRIHQMEISSNRRKKHL
jgi:DNA-binding response OmpR family regulator